jgi:hypothetical protein
MKFVCDLPDVLPEVWAAVPRSRIGVLEFYPPQERHNEIAEKKGGGIPTLCLSPWHTLWSMARAIEHVKNASLHVGHRNDEGASNSLVRDVHLSLTPPKVRAIRPAYVTPNFHFHFSLLPRTCEGDPEK